MKKEIAIRAYSIELSNIEWDLEQNGRFKSKEEIERQKERINDYQNFIQTLKSL